MTKTKPSLTTAQKRVAIAKDVLAQIRQKQYIPKQQHFCEIPNFRGTSLDQKELKLHKPVCQVCAVGAAIVSGIRLFNKLVITDGSVSPAEAKQFMAEFFSRSQTRLIEHAFERGHGYFQFTESFYNKKAREFGMKFDSSELRAIAIFKNIIKHKGIFKP